MLRARTKYLLIGAVVLAALGLSVPQADAQWGWGYYGYAPCYSSCYTPYYGVGYSSYYGGVWYASIRPGPLRRAAFGPYRWYYGGWGGWGCCTTCYSDPCGCWDVGCSDCGGTVIVNSPAVGQPAPTPAPTKAPAKAPTMPAPPKADSGPLPGPAAPPAKLPLNTVPPAATGTIHLQSYVEVDNRSNSGLLTIYVPTDATVTVNNRPTTSVGSQRSYVSFGLQPGYSYKYEIRAQIVRGGKLLEEVKTVHLTAGANQGVAFSFNKAIDSLAANE